MLRVDNTVYVLFLLVPFSFLTASERMKLKKKCYLEGRVPVPHHQVLSSPTHLILQQAFIVYIDHCVSSDVYEELNSYQGWDVEVRVTRIQQLGKWRINPSHFSFPLHPFSV